MAGFTLTCPSCGGSGVLRRERQFLCQYCGASVIPRLLPGTICGDDVSETLPCTEEAKSLCRGCARPLCEWHDGPKRIYWMEPFDPRCMRLDWSAEDLTWWIRLNQPFHRLPAEGFDPFEWVHHQRMSEYAVGQLEFALVQRLQPIVERLGGTLDESNCTFGSLCSSCEGDISKTIRKLVESKRKTYRRVAYEARMNALLAEARQVLAYIEAFLHYPVPDALPETGEEPGPISLSLKAPAQEWERKGREAKARIAALQRLKAKIGRGI
jgi:hypothetical protein